MSLLESREQGYKNEKRETKSKQSISQSVNQNRRHFCRCKSDVCLYTLPVPDLPLHVASSRSAFTRCQFQICLYTLPVPDLCLHVASSRSVFTRCQFQICVYVTRCQFQICVYVTRCQFQICACELPVPAVWTSMGSEFTRPCWAT